MRSVSSWILYKPGFYLSFFSWFKDDSEDLNILVRLGICSSSVFFPLSLRNYYHFFSLFWKESGLLLFEEDLSLLLSSLGERSDLHLFWVGSNPVFFLFWRTFIFFCLSFCFLRKESDSFFRDSDLFLSGRSSLSLFFFFTYCFGIFCLCGKVLLYVNIKTNLYFRH